MTAVVSTRVGWAVDAIVHVHVMAPWWHITHSSRRRRQQLRRVDNVVHLPAPVAGYRIRHHDDGATVEIKPSHAAAIEVCRLPSAAAARAVLAAVSAEHARPFLGEIGKAA